MPTMHKHVQALTQEDLDRLREKKEAGPTDNAATLGFKPFGPAKSPAQTRPTNSPMTGPTNPNDRSRNIQRAPITPAKTAMTGRSTREASLEAHRRVPGAVPRPVNR